MRTIRAAIVAAALAFPVASFAADVTLKSAWMRPAPAGAAAARAYVDIESRAALDLVGASTPVAKRVAIVRVQRIDDPASEEMVTAMPVHAGTTTRLAYRGDHLRFIDVNRDLANGTPVPLTLVFKDAAGREVRATTDVVVRGLLLPQHMPPASRDASSGAPAPSAPEPAPKM